jgi:hypothetical protein
MAFYPFTFLLFSSAPFDPHTQLSLKCRYDHLCCRLDAERGGVDDQVVAQRVGHIVAKMATDRFHPLAIGSFNLNPGGLQTQARFVGDPPGAYLNRRNHPHTQTELSWQNEPRGVADDDHVTLMTEREHHLLQIVQVV